jgi:Ca2+-binding EF-hand superfamily protein
LADCLKAIIFLEKDIEAAKVNLALKHDFNTIDAFRLFDRNNLGCVTPEDLMEGLRFNLHFTDFHHDDIFMLLKKVDRNGIGRITFKQFNELILPFTTEYAMRVADR